MSKQGLGAQKERSPLFWSQYFIKMYLEPPHWRRSYSALRRSQLYSLNWLPLFLATSCKIFYLICAMLSRKWTSLARMFHAHLQTGKRLGNRKPLPSLLPFHPPLKENNCKCEKSRTFGEACREDMFSCLVLENPLWPHCVHLQCRNTSTQHIN